MLKEAKIIEAGKAIALSWQDGLTARFHALWLRDNAQDPETRDLANGQRLITLQQLPETILLTEASLQSEALQLLFQPEDKHIRFDGTWLRERIYDRPGEGGGPKVSDAVQTWDHDFDPGLVTEDYAAVTTNRTALRRWLGHVRRHGFARLEGGPVEPQALLTVVEHFGFVRETNYGRWFEVRSEVNPSNLAFTGLGLQAHTDNPYRDPQPTLQILYCLENAAEGGDNLVVDGFRVAERLYAEDPEGFALLAKHRARFEYRGTGSVHLSAQRPMIEVSADGEITAVRFNNRSTAPITAVPYDEMEAYYRAYRRFGALVEDPALGVAFKLEPGACFIVDNTRVLHGRRAFTSTGGRRWLQGCYPDKDGLLSTLSILEAEDAQ